MPGYRTLLPDAAELIRQYEADESVTYEKIGERYGTSRQAVHKRIAKHLKEQQAETQPA
jgi:biotin operon repressor